LGEGTEFESKKDAINHVERTPKGRGNEKYMKKFKRAKKKAGEITYLLLSTGRVPSPQKKTVQKKRDEQLRKTISLGLKKRVRKR